MSWVGGLGNFATQLLRLNGRVEKNAENIRELRQDLDRLIQAVDELHRKVDRNQDRQENYEQRQELAREKLVTDLENRVLRLQVELLSSNRLISAEPTKNSGQLPSSNGALDS